MSVELIQQKLLTYQCQTILDQENALKEIAQEIALMALARAGFFRLAAFQGGTCLRILYGLQRFSEDLDFALEEADPHFNWRSYEKQLQEEFNAYGFDLEIGKRNKLEKAVKSTFLKADSVGGILVINDARTNKPKLKIKLEIDTHPPQGSQYEVKYLDFPMPYSIKTQNLPSLFAGKCHALLCRPYTKGRDWYDFVWYISKQISVNFELLQKALKQIDPFEKQHMQISPQWLLKQLKLKIKNIDWSLAKQDAARFLRPRELSAIELWSTDFFLSRLEKMERYL